MLDGWMEFRDYLSTVGGEGTKLRAMLDEVLPVIDERLSAGATLPVIYENTGGQPFVAKLVQSEHGILGLKVFAEQSRVIWAPVG